MAPFSRLSPRLAIPRLVAGGAVLAVATALPAAAPAAALRPPAVATQDAPADTAARPVRPEDYGRFEDVGRVTLAPDGRWVAYAIGRVNDRDELRIRPLSEDAGEPDSLVAVPYGSDPTFSDDGRWLAVSVGLSEEKRDALREEDRPVRTSLLLLDLAEGDTWRIASVSAFAFGGGGRWLAYRRYPPEEKAGGDGSSTAPVVVRDLRTDRDVHFGDVREFAWQREGSLLALSVQPAGEAAASGVQLYDAATGNLRSLTGTPGVYRSLAWRRTADDLAALRVVEDTTDRWEDTAHAVVAWTGLASGAPSDHRIDPGAADGLADSLRIAEHRDPRWAADGSRIFFGLQPRDPARESVASFAARPIEREEAVSVATGDSAGTGAEPDTAGVLVWHATDVEIQSRQRVTADRDRRRSHLAAWELGTRRVVRLGDERLEDVELLDGDARAVATDPTPYEEERMFGPEYRDVYLVDAATGERTKVLEKVQYFLGPSPGGRYLLYLEDDDYYAYEVSGGGTANLTGDLAAAFVDLEDDHTVDQKPPFGTAGWTMDDDALLAYSEHDVWRLAPDGSGAANLTRAADRTTDRGDTLRYRFVDLEREEPWEPDHIDPDAPMYLDVYDEWREMHGYALLASGAEAPERLLWQEALVYGLARAEDADVFTYAVESYDDSPDLFTSGADLAGGRQVSHTNPFLADFAWGRSELLAYESRWGEELQGALFYPAEYEPGHRYPLIVYIYEIRSPSARRFSTPSATSPYNTAVFSAEGYFVWQPDIVYRDRNPGRSAVEAIVPSVRRVLETGMIDSTRIGLVGHSWGGYQTAFTVTQTDLFRAAVAGAPLTNLVSMYSSIYWRTGGTDARIFEISQGRMEVPPWEDMESYVANSPLHHVESMETPLLMTFGTDDGAVEFNQGIEFYNATRRAAKPLVMLTYEGENHGISRREANRRDYHDRILAWFDHHLKGEEGPAWITGGVPYLHQQEWKEEKLRAEKDAERDEPGEEKEEGRGEGGGPRP